LFLSAAACIALIISRIIFKKKAPGSQWMAGFAIFFLLLWFVLLFQNYPRHAVVAIYGISIDINQYITRLLWIVSIMGYIAINKRKSSIIRIGI
jgi:hypothetical protein